MNALVEKIHAHLSPVWSIGTNNQPRKAHIAAYPDYQTRGAVLKYLRETGLTGWPNQSVSIHHLHVTLLYSGNLLVPYDFPREQPLNAPIDLSGSKHYVRPLPVSGQADVGTAVAILFPGNERLRKISDLLHKKFKLTVNPQHYIFHMTIADIQLFRPGSKQYDKTNFKHISDYYKLPPYSGRMVLEDVKLSYDDR